MNPWLDTPATPVPYQPQHETLEDDEAETGQALVDTLRQISETVHRDSGHAERSVHAKGHGLLLAELQVLPGLPPVLAQGAFAASGRYPVVMRFSTTPGDLLDDAVSTPRGLAVKIVGVSGDRLPGSEADVTQDFLLVDGPAFLVPTAKKFLKNIKLLAATTDKAPGMKKVLSAAMRGLESVIEKAGGKSAAITSMGGHAATNLLGETYFTQVPFLYGPYMAKLSIAPASPELLALKDAPLDLKDNADALRGVVNDHFRSHGGVWEVRVQLCTNVETMPIEDPSVEWPESESPYVAVARITAVPQTGFSSARSAAVDDGMAFSAWHGLAAHRPLGAINRVRKAAYEMAAGFRSQHNAVKVAEPRAVDSLPA